MTNPGGAPARGAQATLRAQYRDSSNLRARMGLHERFSVNRYPFHRWIFDRLSLPADASILEVGCGPGTLWARNADRVPEAWQLTLTDASPGMAAEARSTLVEAGLDAAGYAASDACAIPFAAGRFDGVIANHMLYHVPDLDQALAEFGRVLKPGGTLFAATNGATHLAELREMVFAVGGVASDPTTSPGRFALENGGQILARRFASVTLTRPEPGGMEITDSDAVVDYVRSWSTVPGDAELRELRDRVDAEITRHGAFRVTQAAGIFCAVRD